MHEDYLNDADEFWNDMDEDLDEQESCGTIELKGLILIQSGMYEGWHHLRAFAVSALVIILMILLFQVCFMAAYAIQRGVEENAAGMYQQIIWSI